MPLLIKLFPGEPLYDQRVRLEGVDYVLKLDWANREQRFYLTISDADNVLIKAGIKVVANWFLLAHHRTAKLPPGEFFAFDLTDTEAPQPPLLNDFGTRVRLFYYASDEDLTAPA